MEFCYTIDPSADEPVMVLNGEIGCDADKLALPPEYRESYVDGYQFAKELLFLDSLGKEKITIHINSIGGSVIEGMAIFSAGLQIKAKVNTYCGGPALSIAGAIFMLGAEREIADFGFWMCHNPYNPDKPDATPDPGLVIMTEGIAKMIALRAGIPIEKVIKWMSRTTWFDATECVTEGIATKEIPSDSKNRPRITKTDEAKSAWQKASVFMNKVTTTTTNKTETTPTMKNICNKLNLNTEASETAIISEIDRISNAHKSEMEKKKEEMDKFKEKYDKLKADYDKLKEDDDKKAKAKLDEDKAKAEADEADKKAKAEEMVDAAIKTGKIKNDATEKGKWIARAIANLTDTKEIIDALVGADGEKPGTKKAANVIDKLPETPGAVKPGEVPAIDPNNTDSYVARMNAIKFNQAKGK